MPKRSPPAIASCLGPLSIARGRRISWRFWRHRWGSRLRRRPGKAIVLDIGEGASHKRGLTNSLVPTLVTQHKIYWLEGGRHLLGQELLFQLGFSHDLDPCGLSHRMLTHMDGNIMSVDILACLSVLLLRFVDFGPDVSKPSHPRRGQAVSFKIPPHPLTSLQSLTRSCLPGMRTPSARAPRSPQGPSSSLCLFDLPPSSPSHGGVHCRISDVAELAVGLLGAGGAVPRVPLVGPAWRRVASGAETYVGLLGNSILHARGGKQISATLHLEGVRSRCRELLAKLQEAGVSGCLPGGRPCSGVAVLHVLPGTPLIPWVAAAAAGEAEAAIAFSVPEPGPGAESAAMAAAQIGTKFLWEPTPEAKEDQALLGPLPCRLVANSVKKLLVLLPCGEVLAGRFHAPPARWLFPPMGGAFPCGQKLQGARWVPS